MSNRHVKYVVRVPVVEPLRRIAADVEPLAVLVPAPLHREAKRTEPDRRQPLAGPGENQELVGDVDRVAARESKAGPGRVVNPRDRHTPSVSQPPRRALARASGTVRVGVGTTYGLRPWSLREVAFGQSRRPPTRASFGDTPMSGLWPTTPWRRSGPSVRFGIVVGVVGRARTCEVRRAHPFNGAWRRSLIDAADNSTCEGAAGAGRAVVTAAYVAPDQLRPGLPAWHSGHLRWKLSEPLLPYSCMQLPQRST